MELDFDFMEKTFGLLWTGVPVTMEITIVSLLLASPIAFYFALNRIKGNPVVSLISRGYVSVVLLLFCRFFCFIACCLAF